MNRSLFAGVMVACLCLSPVDAQTTQPVGDKTAQQRVPVTITGGHDTDGRDRGRPVSLIAAALGVEEAVFRDAFTGVRPSRDGPPSEAEARTNKKALLDKLAKYGVTNERLDEVSNYYRYRRENGETWKQTEAEAYATVANGHVTGITITKAGAGYSSTPTLKIESMPTVTIVPKMAYGKDLATNGSIASATFAERH